MMELGGIGERAFWTVLGLGAALLVLRFFVRPRPPQVTVPALLLWRRAVEGRVSRRLREILALLAQLLALLLLACGLAEVHRSSEDTEGDGLGEGVVLDTVHVVDTSLSMAARGAATTRLERVKAEIEAGAQQLRPGERLALVDGGTPPRVLLAPSSDLSRLRIALRSLQPRLGGQSLASALALAAELPGLERAHIAIHTDDSEVDELVLSGPWPASVRPVGPALPNLSIEAFGLSSNRGLPAEHEAYVRLRNHGLQSVSFLLSLETPEAVLGQAEVEMEAGQDLERVYRFAPRSDGRVELRLRDIAFEGGGEDALALDNAAFAFLEPLRAARVALVTDGNRFLEAALALIPGLRLDVVSPAEFDPGAVRGADLVFYDRVVPGDAPAGNAFYVRPEGVGAPAEVVGEVGNPALSSWNLAHPVLRDVHLDALQVAASLTYEAADGDDVLVRGPDGVNCLAREDGDGHRIVVWGFDFGASDLPLRLAFPRLVFNSLAWARQDRSVGPADGPTLDGGRPYWARGPGVVELLLEGTDAPTGGAPLHALGDGLRPLRTSQPGFWTLRRKDGEPLGRFAANFFEPTESGLLELPRARGEIEPERPREVGVAEAGAQRIWPWLVALSLAFVLIEAKLEAR
jgi:hypothetical protein